MEPIPSRAHRLAAVAAALVILAAAAPTADAHGTQTIPDEPGATVLDRLSYGAVTADLAGDSQRELVSLESLGTDPVRMAVGIWRMASGGTWAETVQLPLRRAARAGELASRGPTESATLPLLISDQARLIVWHDAGQRRVLAVVNSATSFGGAAPCCLTIWEVSADRSGAPRLTLVGEAGGGGDAVISADLDGDGIDELVVEEPPDSSLGVPPVPVTVLRWTGDRFSTLDQVAVPVAAPPDLSTFVLGDSDGRPGVEIGFVGRSPALYGWVLYRLTIRDGLVVLDSMPVSTPGRALAVPGPPGGNGPTILYGDDTAAIRVISWPAGGPPVETEASTRTGRPVALLGDAANPWVVLRRAAPGGTSAEVIRPDLSLVSAQSVLPTDAAALLHSEPADWQPYIGRWPEAGSAADAFLFEGTLLQPAASGAPRQTSIAALADASPVGRLGPGDTWMALARTLPGSNATPPPLNPQGGTLERGGIPFILSIVPVTEVTSAEEGEGLLRPTPVDAVRNPASGAPTAFLTGSGTFLVGVQAPTGSLVLVQMEQDQPPAVVRTLGGPRFAQLPSLVGPAYQIPIVAPRLANVDTSYAAWLYVVTPAGHAYTSTIDVRLMVTTPPLRVGAGMLSAGLSATITGQTAPGTQVVVDGSPAPVTSDGSFRATVSAGLVPREVRVVATDAVGHRTQTMVSVVGPVDYRRLPWIPIVVGLTLAIGALLFVVPPGFRPGAGRETRNAGLFEEIDLD